MLRTALKTVLSLFIAGAIFASCSGAKNTTGATRDSVKGNWTLNDISYQGLSAGESVRLILLDEGTDKCLRGSTWSFPNNGYGSFTVNSSEAGCVAGEKNIVWSYQKGDQPVLQFKKLIGGVAAKDVADGYRLKILSADGSAMELQSEVTYQGSPILINYRFTKN